MISPLQFVWSLLEGDYSPSEALILLSLGYLMRENGAKVSRKFLSIKTGLSTSTVTRVIKRLKNRAVIKVESSKRDDGSTSINIYSFSDYTPTHGEHRGVAPRLDKYSIYYNNNTNISFNKSKNDYTANFEAVYNLYPKKPINRTKKKLSFQKYQKIKYLSPQLIYSAVKNRVDAYKIEHHNEEKEFQYLEGLQILLQQDLHQFLSSSEHEKGEFVMPVPKNSLNIKNTSLIDSSKLMKVPFRSINQINKEINYDEN